MERTPLISKLAAPRVPRVHPRERIFRVLDRARKRRVTWVEAPPGAGKTVAVASWLLARRLRAFWYTLGEGDDVASFFALLARPGRGLRGRVRMELPRFQPEHLASPGAYARQFFRTLSSGSAAPDVVVLDDYHAVHPESLLHHALAEGMAEASARTTFVVASRAGPPRQLSRLRAADELVVVPAASFVLTLAEARAIARLRGRYPLPDRILALANGWAAGVVLLALSAPHGTENGYAKARRSVFDYLATEVFDALDPRTREILLRTCLLATFPATAAARMTGVADAGGVFADLARAGWFVETVPATPPAYRLHALFRDFLVVRAREALGSEGFAALLRASADHLLDSGDVDTAVGLLAAEGEWDELVRVLLERGPALAAMGRLEAMGRWLDALPPRYADAVPWVRFWRGISRGLSDPPAAIASIESAFDAFSRGDDAAGAWRSWAAMVDVRVQALDDVAPLQSALDVLPVLRARFPFPDLATEAAVVAAALTAYSNVRARDPAVRAWEDRALEIALAAGDARVRMDVGRALAFRCAYWGTDLVRARLVLEALKPIATTPGADPAHALMWHFGEANYYAHLGAAAASREAADRGLAVAERSGVHAWDAVLLSVRIYGSLAADDVASADADLRALAVAAGAAGRLAACSYQYTAATVALRRGDFREAVERSRAAAHLAEECGHPLGLAACQVVWAAAAARGGERGPTLEEAGASAARAGYEVAEMGVSLLAAHAALASEAEQDTEASLRSAFEVAKRTGVLNSVYVRRAEMAELCAFALERGIEPELAAHIASARGLAPGPRARRVATWPWTARVRALGGFELRIEGRAPPSGKAQKKPLELLRLLLAHGERGGTLARLADALWPDADGDTAHHALETTLTRLRQLLGDPAAVVRRGGQVSLDHGRVFVDAWAVEDLAARAEALRARGDVAGASRAAAAAIELYRGDLLPEDELPEVAARRSRLRERIQQLAAPQR